MKEIGSEANRTLMEIGENMKIKELHSDIERYLYEDCYCPNEIYDSSGFFFRCFDKDDECVLIGEKKEKTEKSGTFIACISDDQILIFFTEDNKVVDATIYDATENNIEIIKLISNCVDVSERSLDEFKKGETKKNIQEIMRYADAIITD